MIAGVKMRVRWMGKKERKKKGRKQKKSIIIKSEYKQYKGLVQE